MASEPIVDLINLHDLGDALITLRIRANITQRELARRMGVDESQVSRDERHHYKGVTLARAGAIIEALGYTSRTWVESLNGAKP